MELTDTAENADLATNSGRVANRARLRDSLVAALARWQRKPLLEALAAANVPAGPINDIADMFADPQILARRMQIDLHDQSGNAIPSVRSPIVMSRTPLRYHRPSPRLGEHTGEIMAELEGLTDEDRR